MKGTNWFYIAILLLAFFIIISIGKEIQVAGISMESNQAFMNE